jgi:serine/threonine-protein kinase HipA
MAIGDKHVTHHYSSSYDDIGRAIDVSPLPLFTEPQEAKLHLLRRLLFALATGNGDLHMENLAVVRRDGRVAFSPVYDPTSMRAYTRHDLLSVMPFGGYGEEDERGQPVHLADALRRLAKNMGISRALLRRAVEEALGATDRYLDRVFGLAHLPEANKLQLKTVLPPVRTELSRV